MDRNTVFFLWAWTGGVALRKESVDRNTTIITICIASKVALRKESVDRNVNCDSNSTQNKHVALRKESVDRNLYYGDGLTYLDVALRKESVDRNGLGFRHYRDVVVALRKESVDRNYIIQNLTYAPARSLSARRAWIEIAMTSQISVTTVGRSPQGERG